MDLKKNDKMILVAGVVILVIAAIGVAVYTSPDTGKLKAGDTEPEYETYSYTWTRNTGETTIEDNLYVGKKSLYSDSFTITASSGSVLTDVEVQINWEDDSTYGLLITKGEDTLTADVGQQGGEPIQESSEGSGNMTFVFNLNDIPSSDSVLAEDKSDAESIIDGMFPGENDGSFDIEVSVETGEKFWRPLKFLKDKGNAFELKAKYTYYVYEVEEPEVPDEDEDKTTGDDGGYHAALGEFYKNLCYGRGMI
ncbi:MAG: hypothetical protein U9R21_03665 [Candidatus Thermoplasmatota archaeon]|nr:hypothetical protein [Candidatus Thermoplasmatota archaeon]